jgi:hypothetical protein
MRVRKCVVTGLNPGMVNVFMQSPCCSFYNELLHRTCVFSKNLVHFIVVEPYCKRRQWLSLTCSRLITLITKFSHGSVSVLTRCWILKNYVNKHGVLNYYFTYAVVRTKLS